MTEAEAAREILREQLLQAEGPSQMGKFAGAIDPGDLLRVTSSSLSKTVLKEHSRLCAVKGSQMAPVGGAASVGSSTRYADTNRLHAPSGSSSSASSPLSEPPSAEELMGGEALANGAATQRPMVAEGEKMGARESDACGALRFIGYLAGISGGHFGGESLGWVALRVFLKSVFAVTSVVVTLSLVPLLTYDTAGHVYFWMRSLGVSFERYLSTEAQERGGSKGAAAAAAAMSKIHSPSRFSEDEFDAGRWDPAPWESENPIIDWAFQIYVAVLLGVCCPRELFRCGSHVSQFRRFLGLHPPHFPLSPNDDIFQYDAKGKPFQLSMLFMLDSITYEEVCEAFRRRWIQWEAKTRAVASRRWGKCCWRVLDDEEFDLEKHIVRKSVDLSETSVAQVVSEMGSEEMDAALPQWRIWVLETTPGAAPASETPRHGSSAAGSCATPSDVHKMSYVCGKWHHVYSDGVGMMTSIVSRLGDKGVSTDHLPEQYRRRVPWWQVFLYYLYHSLRASTEVAEHFLYNAYGVRPFPAIMQAGDEDGSLRAPGPITGRKHYSRPAVVSLMEINRIRKGLVRLFPTLKIKPTVNDIFSYCLCSSWAQLQHPKRLQEIVRNALSLPLLNNRRQWIDKISAHPNYSRPSSDRVLSLIIPMMCRTSVPTRMDNFTSLVPARLPLPVIEEKAEHCGGGTAEEILDLERQAVLRDLLSIKDYIDLLKAKNSRTIMFLITCAICKAFPENLKLKIHNRMYCNTQFCSTNVAAPPIDSKFFGRVVHGLFFWPAVPTFATSGSSVVSLGDRFQMLTILDEAELLPAVIVANRLLQDFGLEVNDVIKDQLLLKMADVLIDLVQQEFKKLAELFGEKDTTNPEKTTSESARDNETNTGESSGTDTSSPPSPELSGSMIDAA